MEKDLSFFYIISNLGKIVLVLNTILYFKSYRKNSVAFKIFTNYLLFTLIIQLVTGFLAYNKENNIYLSHYYFLGQFLFLSFFYKKILEVEIKIKLINLCLIIIPILVIITYIVSPDQYYKFNLVEVILTSIPIVFFAFLHFFENLNFSKKFIYINSGIFIYLISSTFLFSVGDFIHTSTSAKAIKLYVWFLNIILYLIYQILIFVEWYKNFRKPVIKNKTK